MFYWGFCVTSIKCLQWRLVELGSVERSERKRYDQGRWHARRSIVCQSGQCSGACRGKELSKIVVSAIFPHLPTFWLCRLFAFYTTPTFYSLLTGAGPQIDDCLRRTTWNDASLPVNFTGGPALYRSVASKETVWSPPNRATPGVFLMFDIDPSMFTTRRVK